MLRVVFVLGLGLAAASCGVRPEVQMAQDDQECQSMGAQPRVATVSAMQNARDSFPQCFHRLKNITRHNREIACAVTDKSVRVTE